MKRMKKSTHLVFIFMLGFLMGIIYTNISATNYVTITNFFHENYLINYFQIESHMTEYVSHILKYRMLQFTFLSFLFTTKYRKVIAILLLLWTGFSSGVLAVTAVLSLGLSGVILCFIALFPHFLLYGSSYAILIIYSLKYPEGIWNKEKTIVIFVLQFTGILAEGYLNPWLMKFLLSMFF